MIIKKIKLSQIADVISGLPINRYYIKESDNQTEIIEYNIIQQKSLSEINTKFNIDSEELNQQIDEKFFTQKGDILFKLQAKCFAKQITTETDAIVTHAYAIIRLKEGYNPTFIETILNDKQVLYELERKISSTTIPKININALKNLELPIPDQIQQEEYAKIFELINNRIQLLEKQMENEKQLQEALITEIIGDFYDY